MDKLEKRILLGLGCVAAVLLALVLTRKPPEREIIVNEFVPPPFEAAAVTGLPPLAGQEGYGVLALGDHAAVSLHSAPAVENGAVQVYFAVSSGSTAWVRLRLLDSDGNTLGETGLLRPGEYVEWVALERLPDEVRSGACDPPELTDDAAIFMRAGGQVRVVRHDAPNPKITYRADLDM